MNIKLKNILIEVGIQSLGYIKDILVKYRDNSKDGNNSQLNEKKGD